MKTAGRKRWRKVLLGIGLLVLLFLLLPYLIPLSLPAGSSGTPPFENSAFLVLDGISFHYRVYQPPIHLSKGKLLLLHGLAGSTFSFDALAPWLAGQGYLVVSVDQPGFGYSDRTVDYDYSQDNRARDLWRLLSQIEARLPQDLVAQPWYLAGHSMGGKTAAAMALQEPARARGLILIDAALFSTNGGNPLMQLPPLKQWLLVAAEHHFLRSERAFKNVLISAYGQTPTAEQIAGYLTPLRLPGTVRSMTSMLDAEKKDAQLRYQDLVTPTLAIWGENDTWVPLGELAKLKDLLPHIRAHIVAGAAHCPMETHTSSCADIILPWLATNE